MINFLTKDIEDKKLTEIDKIIIRFIKNDPNRILKLSINDFAKLCLTTKSSIVKTLQKIGIDGYKALKQKITNNLISKSSENKNNKLLIENIDAISATSNLIEDKLAQIINLIEKSKKIAITGGGSLKNIANIFADQLSKMGKESNAYDIEGGYLTSSDFDLVIIISNSGINPFVYKKASFFKKQGIKIISITSSNSTNIKEKSEINLTGPRLFVISDKEYHLPRTSISVLWYMIQAILEKYYDLNKEKVESILKAL